MREGKYKIKWNDLKKCIICGNQSVRTSYLEDRRYRFKCNECGQYFEFNASSWIEAEVMWKHIICKEETKDGCNGFGSTGR